MPEQYGLSTRPANAVTAKLPNTALSVQVNFLKESLNQVEERLGLLIGTLEPLMRPSAPASENPAAGGAYPSMSPLADQLDTCCRRVRRIADALSELTGRLDV